MSKLQRRVTAGFAVLVVLVIAGGAWHEFHDRIFPKRWGVVVPDRIYRSGQLHPALVEKTLRDHHIKVVVDLQFEDGTPAQAAESRAIRDLGITQYRFPLNGNGTGDIKHYAAAIARIKASVDAGEPVLVHCAAGTQRTGGVIAAYETLVEGKKASAAIGEMEAYDWDPVKNRVLLAYLDEHMDELATLLVEMGVLKSMPAHLPDFEAALPD